MLTIVIPTLDIKQGLPLIEKGDFGPHFFIVL